MVRRLAAVTAAAVTLSFGLAGCGSDAPTTTGTPTTTTTTAAAANGDAVAWADKVCAAVGPEVEKFKDTPKGDPNNLQATKDGFVTYLDGMAQALDRMISGIKDAGAPPVTDGDAAAKAVENSLATAKDTVTKAKDNLAKVDASNPQAFQAGMAQVGQDLQGLSQMEDPTKGLRGNKELNDAFEKSEKCKALNEPATSATPTS
ncbi:hypothetical protein SAMN05192558_109167 [Actinokineospora alba]|uniref:Small secreted protein n=1 Tax=Actinokineospora alba TaxID=504798 RepID=A0A1H0SYJ9_9PSEU|nr:hypothetical protein [Actinokineospora alba]TDP66465.1 hypothetical protein C8E96_1974 [Actinokineospora alba]SDJ52270.1 hypothetical protein SAMN05421871_11837 [Actinokineospora alba]SDP46873.1 hypothetical protein SAMN05192558_109167 [Actinokineospora alba]